MLMLCMSSLTLCFPLADFIVPEEDFLSQAVHHKSNKKQNQRHTDEDNMFSVETHTKDDRRGKETKGDFLPVGGVNSLFRCHYCGVRIKRLIGVPPSTVAAGCCKWCLCRPTVSSRTSGVELLFCTVTTGARGNNSQISDWRCTQGSDVTIAAEFAVCVLGLLGGGKEPEAGGTPSSQHEPIW